MVSVRELTDPYVAALTRVPRVEAGICRVCRSVPNPGFDVCYSCAEVMGQVTRPVAAILPISMCEPLGQLHTLLRNYKDSRDPEVRSAGRTRLAAIMARFLDAHGTCVAPDGWDAITFVPTSSGREGRHPFERVLTRMPGFGDQVDRLLDAGPALIQHNQASDRGFETTDSVDGRRLLLADDTLTTGARLQSAASALHLAGAHLVGAVVVGRFFRPGWGARHMRHWEELRGEPFDFATCGLES